MTTVDAPNVRAIAVDGTFDDCQDLVKAMFNDAPFRERMRLSAMNSINWARVIARSCTTSPRPGRSSGPVTACVPTGNFGNVFAGWVARRMGTPIEDFIVASNANDILTRFVNDGDMSVTGVVPTLSPSMDIQISSNFERMLWVMNEGNGPRTGEQLQHFRQHGHLDGRRRVDGPLDHGRLPRRPVDRRRGARRDRPRPRRDGPADRSRTRRPARSPPVAAPVRHPVVTMSTAHPAKFPDAVERATGIRPALPEHLADLYDRPERTETVANDLAVVEDLVAQVSRVA